MGDRRRRYSVVFVGLVSTLVSIIVLHGFGGRARGASATLLWTASGDDGTSGRASRYDLRMSTNAISGTDTLTWWNAATVVDLAGKVPPVAGAQDSFLVTGLLAGTRYYAILRMADEVPNWSGFSNVAIIEAADGTATVRGAVRDAASGAALAGALVQGGSAGSSALTQADGTYSIAVPSGMPVTITGWVYAYGGASATLTLSAGSSQTLDFPLTKLPTGILTGVVRNASNGTVLSAAEIVVSGTPLVGTSGTDGRYQLTVPQGTLTARCERPGFRPSARYGAVLAGLTTTVDFKVTPALYYDDEQRDRGWVIGAPGDSAITGVWTRADPAGTWKGDIPVQPGADHTPEGGTACFVTGNGTSSSLYGEADVDLGRTTLASPTLELAGFSDPRIVYWRWYTNNSGAYPGQDPFVTQISNNGGPWVTVESLYATLNFWHRVEIRVTEYFSNPGDVRVRFIAMDTGGGSIVEAAIDDFEYYSASVVTDVESPTTSDVPELTVGAPRPSPSSGAMEIDFDLGRSTLVNADIFSVEGRRLRTLERRVFPAGRHRLYWDGSLDRGGNAASGVYWLRVGAGTLQKRVKLVVIR